MYKVKLSTIKNTNYILRQTKGGNGISHCGKYKFYVDEDIADPDFLVMRNKYIKKPVSYNVSPRNTVVMISEPKSVVNYPQHYLDQFALFHSCQPDAKHSNIIFGPAALPWYIGKISPDGNHPITYDILKNSALPEKTKLISVITSNKAFTKGHQARIDFVAKLKERYGDIIDVYGRGFNEFKDKWDVLAPYKYHITIENSVSRDYWTEKISDCYLTGTLPIYHGCSNITEYFPEDGLIKIDINNFEAASAIIDKVIENDIYNSRIAALQRCKDLVLDDYNLFTLIAKCCDRLNPDAPKKTVTIKPSKTAFDPYNFYLYFIERNYYVFKGWIKSITGKNAKLKQK